MRGAFWALFPLLIAWTTRNHLTLRIPPGGAVSAQTVFSGLYSESTFSKNPTAFYSAMKTFAAINLCLLGRMYGLVVFGSIVLGFITRYFGWVRARMSRFPRISKVLYLAVLPRISEWHVALSPMLLENRKQHSIEVDVMTKSGILYRGSVSEKSIGSDGNLQTLILAAACRFLHTDFVRDRTQFEGLDDKTQATKPSPDKYWRKIPGVVFYIVGSDITSVNIRHVDQISSVEPNKDEQLQSLLREVNRIVEQQRARDAGT